MRNLKKPSTRNVNIPSSSDTCFSITPLKKLPSADFNGVPLCIRVSDPLAVNLLLKGDTSPTRRSLPRANRTDRCCGGLRRSRAPPCQNCLKKSPSADFDGVPLCIPVSNPLAVNSLSKGTPPLPDAVYRKQIGLTDAAGHSAKVGHPLPKLPEKIILSRLRWSPALHPSE